MSEINTDDIGEKLLRKLAGRTSRRRPSRAARRGDGGRPALPCPAGEPRQCRQAGPPAAGRTASPATPRPRTTPSAPTRRYCAIDGPLCSCCGGGIQQVPGRHQPSPTSWVGTCINPDDNKAYLIAYRDCCGKPACGLVRLRRTRIARRRLYGAPRPTTTSSGASASTTWNITAPPPSWSARRNSAGKAGSRGAPVHVRPDAVGLPDAGRGAAICAGRPGGGAAGGECGRHDALPQSDYVEQCAGCHGIQGTSAPANIPVLGSGGLLHVPAGGAQLPDPAAQCRTIPGSPTNDRQLADLMNFVLIRPWRREHAGRREALLPGRRSPSSELNALSSASLASRWCAALAWKEDDPQMRHAGRMWLFYPVGSRQGAAR